MAMQVNSLSIGNTVAVSAPVEIPQEKRLPLPGEQKADAVKPEAALPAVFGPGSGKNQIQNLKQTTSELERISLAFNRRLKFEIDQESRDIRIKVIDNETDKVIKVLPPEELQRLHSRIRETLGFLFDKMV